MAIDAEGVKKKKKKKKKVYFLGAMVSIRRGWGCGRRQRCVEDAGDCQHRRHWGWWCAPSTVTAAVVVRTLRGERKKKLTCVAAIVLVVAGGDENESERNKSAGRDRAIVVHQ